MSPDTSKATTKKKGDWEWLQQEENKERIVSLLIGYEKLMDLALAFIDSTDITRRRKLNRKYIELLPLVDTFFHELLLGPKDGSTVKLKSFFIPFDDLLGAEDAYQERGVVFNKESVLKDMGATDGEIKRIWTKTNAGDKHRAEDFRKYLNDIDSVIRETVQESEPATTTLAGKTICYDKKLKAIIVGDDENKPCRLSKIASSSQRGVAEIMLNSKYHAGSKLDWEQLYVRIWKASIAEPGKKLRQKEKIKGAVREINAKVTDTFGDTGEELFGWKQGFVVRNF